MPSYEGQPFADRSEAHRPAARHLHTGPQAREARERCQDQAGVGRIDRADPRPRDQQAGQRRTRRERERLVGGGDRHHARQDLARDQTGEDRRTRRPVERPSRCDHDDHAVQQPHAHGVPPDSDAQQRRRRQRHCLREHHQAASVATVGIRAADQHEHRRRYELHQADQSEMKRRAGEREYVPGDASPQQGGGAREAESTGEKDAEVAVERRSRSRRRGRRCTHRPYPSARRRALVASSSGISSALAAAVPVRGANCPSRACRAT